MHHPYKFGEGRTSKNLDTGPAPKTLTMSGRQSRHWGYSIKLPLAVASSQWSKKGPPTCVMG